MGSRESYAFNRRQLLASAFAGAAGAWGCDVINVTTNPVGGDRNPIATDPDSGLQFIPEISSNDDFYVYYCCGTPDLDTENWSCRVLDRGVEVGRIDNALLDTLVPVELEHTLQCIGSSPRSPLISNALWSGVPLTEVFDAIGVTVDSAIQELAMEAYDAYFASIPIADLDQPVWLVWLMNGEPLPFEHGGPARLLVPGRYGVKNLKWLSRLELTDVPEPNFWDAGGWSPTAEYRANGFILVPSSYDSHSPGDTIKILGTAFAGLDAIARVEITMDGGDSWQEATIDYSPGANIWTLWSYEFRPSAKGTYVVQCRVTTVSGKTSVLDPNGSDSLLGYDGGMQIEVEVI